MIASSERGIKGGAEAGIAGLKHGGRAGDAGSPMAAATVLKKQTRDCREPQWAGSSHAGAGAGEPAGAETDPDLVPQYDCAVV